MKSGLWRTVGVIYVALALAPLVVFALYFPAMLIWREFYRSDYPGPSEVSSPERVAELAKKGLIEQLITFPDAPVGVRKDPQTEEFDLYVIGVGQTTLPDEITPVAMFSNDPVPPLFDRAPVKLSYASSNPVLGRFNNIIIYEPKTGKLTPMFAKRLAVSMFKYVSGPRFEVMVALAADEDSDKDGKLTLADRQDAYVLSLNDQVLHKVSGLEGNPIEITDVGGHSFVIVRTALDVGKAVGKDGADYVIPEPNRMFRVDLTTYSAEPVVPADLLDKLQKTLDGRAK